MTDFILAEMAAVTRQLFYSIAATASVVEEADMLSFLDLIGHSTDFTITNTNTNITALTPTPTPTIKVSSKECKKLYSYFYQDIIGNCSICLEDFTAKDLCCRLECTHLFHEDCVARWLEKQSSCPLCRAATAT